MGKRVLIVEDNALNMMLLRDIIANFTTSIVSSDGDGNILDLVKKEEPDIILMDIQLPGDIMGDEWISRIRADDELKDIRIYAITAFALAGDKERMISAGADEYIVKPIQVQEFLPIIRAELEA